MKTTTRTKSTRTTSMRDHDIVSERVAPMPKAEAGPTAKVLAFVPDLTGRPRFGERGRRYPFIRPGQIICGVSTLGQPRELVRHVMATKRRVEEGKRRRDAFRGIVP